MSSLDNLMNVLSLEYRRYQTGKDSRQSGRQQAGSIHCNAGLCLMDPEERRAGAVISQMCWKDRKDLEALGQITLV